MPIIQYEYIKRKREMQITELISNRFKNPSDKELFIFLIYPNIKLVAKKGLRAYKKLYGT